MVLGLGALAQQPQPQPQQRPPLVYVIFNGMIDPRGAQSLMSVFANIHNAGAQTVHLGINSLGGYTDQAFYLFNALRALPLRLITHNISTIQSAANILFLSGEHRYASRNATFMLHHTSHGGAVPVTYDQFSIKDRMRALTTDDENTARLVADETELPLKTVKSWFRGSVIRNAEFAAENGLIDEIAPFEVPEGVPIVQVIV